MTTSISWTVCYRAAVKTSIKNIRANPIDFESFMAYYAFRETGILKYAGRVVVCRKVRKEQLKKRWSA